MFKRALMAIAIASAAASSQAGTLLSESFKNVSALAGSGWVLNNQSTPGGTTNWYQGDAGIFAAQAGPAESYAAANYNNAPVGGTISNWLITPTFSTELGGTVSFWARGDIFDGFSDHLAYGLSSTGGSNTGDFTLGSAVTVSGDWTLYTLAYGANGVGSSARFAIVYIGEADLSNYVGVDTLTVTSVPEPSSMLMLGAGLLGLAAFSRRTSKR